MPFIKKSMSIRYDLHIPACYVVQISPPVGMMYMQMWSVFSNMSVTSCLFYVAFSVTVHETFSPVLQVTGNRVIFLPFHCQILHTYHLASRTSAHTFTLSFEKTVTLADLENEYWYLYPHLLNVLVQNTVFSMLPECERLQPDSHRQHIWYIKHIYVYWNKFLYRFSKQHPDSDLWTSAS